MTSLTGKISTEVPVQTPAAEFYDVFATKLIDGKVTTCKETIEAIDEQNKSITFKLFDEDISQHYKVLKIILQVVDKNDGGATAKYTIEYEKTNEDVEPPYGYLQLYDKCTKEIEAYLVKAKKNNN